MDAPSRICPAPTTSSESNLAKKRARDGNQSFSTSVGFFAMPSTDRSPGHDFRTNSGMAAEVDLRYAGMQWDA
jgi:hypothetical protein